MEFRGNYLYVIGIGQSDLTRYAKTKNAPLSQLISAPVFSMLIESPTFCFVDSLLRPLRLLTWMAIPLLP